MDENVPSASWPNTPARRVLSEPLKISLGHESLCPPHPDSHPHSSCRISAPPPATVEPLGPGTPRAECKCTSRGEALHHSWVRSVKCLSCLLLVNDPSPLWAQGLLSQLACARPTAAARGSLVQELWEVGPLC